MFYRYIIAMIVCFGALGADETSPTYQNPTTTPVTATSMLDTLISGTEKQLEAEKKLRDQVVKYVQVQQKYAQNTQDKELATKVVRKASFLYKKIKELELTQAFDQKFLSELAFFSNIADKQKTTPTQR